MFDAYTGTDRMAHIEFLDTDDHLLVYQSDTSDETSEYGVYDYKNDVIYPGLGDSSIGGSTTPIAFVGADKLLSYSQDENQKYKLSVIDFQNKNIKDLLVDKQVQDVYPKYGKQLLIKVGADPVNGLTTFALDPVTLDLKQQ